MLQKRKMEEADQKEEEPVVEDILVEIPEEEPLKPEEATTLEQMREVIENWEKLKTERARGLLGTPETSP